MKNIFNYTIASITRYGYKNLTITFIFGVLVWLLSSVLMITNSLNNEYKSISKEFPDILVSKSYGGRSYLIEGNLTNEFLKIAGIKSAKGRVWGQYYFERNRVYLSIFGIKSFEEQYQKEIEKIAEVFNESKNPPFMITSKSILKVLEGDLKLYKSVPFFTPENSMIKVNVGGVYKFNHSLENNDVILLDEDVAREILGIKKPYFSDITIDVSNPSEVDFIAKKIAISNSNLKVITKDSMLKQYQLLFDYKSGLFLMLFVICFVTFATVLYDKASGLRSEEKREIGILKALGWEISHIINYKLMESLILSVFAFVIGVSLAIFFVYILQAPFLKQIFVGYSELKFPFELVFNLNFKIIALLFFVTVPLYVAVCIIPAWKIAVSDAGEILR
ncbi:ABC transporter permease [Campylobacter ureolyticus]|uniref:ABC transporter permease n=1 Tax=Campylobacter ureolyticus TaxID=827 RepID=UPI001FC8410F|nr:FtsX-like permease family protein [Campylobacter ureolyticus]GKH59970.1 ABC transporter permease [Campylobacter ureolyticus]